MCRVCAPSVVTHSILDWVEDSFLRLNSFLSQQRALSAASPFACDPGREIIRWKDGIRGQGRLTLGHAKATIELGEVGKG